jgi:hypothetical protein
MTKRLLAVLALVAVLTLCSAGFILSAGTQDQSRRLITEQERQEFQSRMRAAKTPEEQEQIRRQNHQLMRERSKKQGSSEENSGKRS